MDPNVQQQIIDALGIGSLPAEEREAAVMRVGEIIFQEVMARIFDMLNAGQQKELEKMLDDDKGVGEIFSYIQAHVPDFDAIINEEAARFRDETLKVTGK